MKTLFLAFAVCSTLAAAGIGIFDADGSVGAPPQKGSAESNAAMKLGVCSHNANVLERAVFSNVKVEDGSR